MSRKWYERIGPLGLWNLYKDDWLVTRQASRLFVLSTVIVLAMTPIFEGWLDPKKMTFWTRLPWGILGIIGPIALFFLWIGMWRYWVRVDSSSAWAKRFWFLVLLIGFWWGSCLYCFSAYLPQVLRRHRAEA